MTSLFLLCFWDKQTSLQWKQRDAANAHFQSSKFCSRSTLQLTISQNFHMTLKLFCWTRSLLQPLEFLDYGTCTNILHTTWVSFRCYPGIHYWTRVCLTITQIHLVTFFTNPHYFEFFLQILQFGPILHQLHSGEQAGIVQAFHNSKQ